MKDYYSILGVARDSSDSDIKQAFRRLAMKHHPDRGGDAALFQDINEAYATLSDPERRAQYDQGGTNRVHINWGPSGGNFNFDDIFQMFGANLRGQRQAMARLNLWVTLEDVARGGPRVISVQQGNAVSNVEIEIPVGIADGDTIRYPRMAPDGTDLIITYRIKPHDRWQRQDQDIIATMDVNIWDLILGCELPVIDLTGAKLILAVPARTQPGSLLRIRGKGLPYSTLPGKARSGPGGDLLVRVQARLPQHIDQDLLDAIQRHRGH